MDVGERLKDVRAKIEQAKKSAEGVAGDGKLIAVSKTHGVEKIEAAIHCGQRLFGENRVQEAMSKWPALQAKWQDIELHLIGPLQSNKVKDAVALFDVVQTVDRPKIARAFAKEFETQNRTLKLFVQVNVGEEPQKAGIPPQELAAFLKLCRGELKLKIEGLMCIPPVDQVAAPYFAFLRKLADENSVASLSMGMSGDYETAVQLGADYVRVGSAIFGERD